jgi:hypothetical protein
MSRQRGAARHTFVIIAQILLKWRGPQAPKIQVMGFHY